MKAAGNDNTQTLEYRTIVVGLVWNQQNQLLFCKMPDNRGVFPDQWGMPGGGIEPNERMTDALKRELKEELGIEITDIKPAFFKDGEYEKTFADGSKKQVYMIFLLFYCRAVDEDIVLNDEFSEYKWVREDDVKNLSVNSETKDTLLKIGDWKKVWR